MRIVVTKEFDKKMITDFFICNWGTPQMVISSGIYQCDELDGFAIVDHKEKIMGLITYVISDNECEIISLDSKDENKGIGTALLNQVEAVSKKSGCCKIKLVTTNDNLHAFLFYQKKGYQIAKIFPNSVEKARIIKPEIPKKADNGIPIRDEILFEKSIL